MAFFHIVLAVAAGFAMAVQPGVNGMLARGLGSPLRGSVVSFGIGLSCLLVLALLMGVGFPTLEQVRQLPWWAWIGGILGAAMVTISLLIAPRMGATIFFAFVLSAQLALAVALDHFGWLGYSKSPASLTRILGVLLLIVGALMVNWRTSKMSPSASSTELPRFSSKL